MPKKTAHTRSATQRNKPKTQKSIELVHQTSTKKEVESESGLEEESNGAAISTATATTSENEEENTKSVATTASTTKTSASARLAARRQLSQKTQRSTATLITAEHYRYVRNDLIYIAILAAIMFSILIVLFFVLR
jgi:cobalamin biosynthesis Mg chelatase CobN